MVRRVRKVFSLASELGRGEQGIAYNVGSSRVLKVTAFAPPEGSLRGAAVERKIAENQAAWSKEAALTKMFGELGVGPTIYDMWICDNSGYLLMQRMKDDLRKYVGTNGKPIGEKIIYASGAKEYDDHIKFCPLPIQKEYVTLLVNLINRGYMHMDNHPGNLGIVVGADRLDHAILFDFGYTVAREFKSEADKIYALGFSLAQIVEHVPLEELLSGETHIFNIVVSIAQGTYRWGTTVPGAFDIRRFMAENSGADQTKKAVTGEALPAGVTDTFYYGFRIFCRVLTSPRVERGVRKNIGTVYNIRQSKAFKKGGKRTNTRRLRKSVNKTRRH